MSRSLSLALLLLLVALAVGAALWWGSEGPDAGAIAPAPAATPELVERGGETGLSVPGPDASPGPDSAPDERIAVAHQDAADQNFPTTDAIWVEGLVVLPPGTPADEQVEIFATTASPWATGRAKLASALARSQPVLARARVGPDGRFRVPFPGGTEAGHLSLFGRYVYLPESVAIELPAQPLALEPKLGARITGRVLPPASAAPDVVASMVGFRVDLESALPQRSNGRNFLTELDDDLGFEFNAVELRKGEIQYLWCNVDGFALAKGKLTELSAGEHATLDFELSVGGRVVGRMVDEGGAGVMGVNVSFERDNYFEPYDELRQDVSDADGRFDLRGLHPGSLRLDATREGWKRARSDKIVALEGQTVEGVVFTISRGNMVAGEVLWPDGKPAARARIVLTESIEGDRRGEGWHTEQTDEQGRFEVSGLHDGPWRLTAERALPGQEDALWSVRVKLVEASTDLTLVLEAPVGIAGRVVDDLGAGLKSFRLRYAEAEEVDRFGNLGNAKLEDFLDEDGRFVLDLGAGDWTVSASADGHDDSEFQSVVVPGSAELEFTLMRKASVIGRVFEPGGSPAAEAQVQFTRSGEAAWAWMSESVQADEEGRFEKQGVWPGAVSVRAQGEEWAESTKLELVLEPGEKRTGIELSLRVGGKLTGEIFGQAGQPDPGRRIDIRIPGPWADGGSVTSDARGYFEADHLAPGSYQVAAVPDLSALESTDPEDVDRAALFAQVKMGTAEIVEGQTTHIVLGAPPADPVRLFGQVTAAGEPVSGGMLMALVEGTSMLDSLKVSPIGSDGRYEITLNEPGDYNLIVGKVDGNDPEAEFHVRIPEVEAHEVDLSIPVGGIRGRVFDPDGDALADVPIVLESHGAPSIFLMGGGRSATSGEDGSYLFENLAPGTYTLRAGLATFGQLQKAPIGVQVRSGLIVEADRILEGIDLELSPPGTIAGTVRDAGDQPVAGATLYFRDAEARLINPVSACVTHGSGRFVFNQSPMGLVTVTARMQGQSTAESDPVLVEPGETAEVELTLEAATILRVDTLDMQGKPVSARVQVLDQAGRDTGTMNSMSAMQERMSEGFSTSSQRFGPLPAGRYQVVVEALDGRTASKPVRLAGQEERTIKVRLKD